MINFLFKGILLVSLAILIVILLIGVVKLVIYYEAKKSIDSGIETPHGNFLIKDTKVYFKKMLTFQITEENAHLLVKQKIIQEGKRDERFGDYFYQGILNESFLFSLDLPPIKFRARLSGWLVNGHTGKVTLLESDDTIPTMNPRPLWVRYLEWGKYDFFD